MGERFGLGSCLVNGKSPNRFCWHGTSLDGSLHQPAIDPIKCPCWFCLRYKRLCFLSSADSFWSVRRGSISFFGLLGKGKYCFYWHGTSLDGCLHQPVGDPVKYRLGMGGRRKAAQTVGNRWIDGLWPEFCQNIWESAPVVKPLVPDRGSSLEGRPRAVWCQP